MTLREKAHVFYEKQKLKWRGRYTSGSTLILGRKTRYVDAKSFLAAYRAIFENDAYAFLPRNERPVIIDGGANVGLATLYWKMNYKDSDVIAFEPDPMIFDVLKWNCENHGYNSVQLINKGLWSENGKLTFHRDGADAGSVENPDRECNQKCDDKLSARIRSTTVVSCTGLEPYLDQDVDLLKLDVEGAELEVLRGARSRLANVYNVVVEYHSYVGQEQGLGEIVNILTDTGFRVHVTAEYTSDQPLVERPEDYGMDNRLHIYGFRPDV